MVAISRSILLSLPLAVCACDLSSDQWVLGLVKIACLLLDCAFLMHEGC